MIIVSSLLLFILGFPAVMASLYLLLMTAFSATARTPAASSQSLRFDLIVPAHDEMLLIERTIASLRRIFWPADRFRIITVADNCTDDTARVAAEAGAIVLVRNDPSKRGKGYALAHAFAASRADRWADAVVVIDADSEVSANLLQAFAARLEGGVEAVQAHYGVRNPLASWRTRLITIAMGAFHIVRSRARERLGLSCGIRGNGWCVTHRLLGEVPYEAYSLAEDIEYGIAIGLAGFRVAYADEAHADADMVSSGEVARQQRQRWEDGRFQLVRSKTLALLAAGWRKRSLVCLDLALDLLVLPLSYVVLNVLAFTLVASAAYSLDLCSSLAPWAAADCWLCLVAYVARGWRLSGVGARGAWDLARVPWFLAWKVWLVVMRRGSREWLRTGREADGVGGNRAPPLE
jgi:cellulose synthase/poly-beta-1,6-N-acetylglucosamine synthase-like glycosyltransferase